MFRVIYSICPAMKHLAQSRFTGEKAVPTAEVDPGPLFSARGRLRRESEGAASLNL
jgi:hypothetical protein